MQTPQQALKESIRHWVDNLADPMEKVSVSSGACALCDLYFKRDRRQGVSCDDLCPVKKATGKDGCEDTPYELAVEAFSEWEDAETYEQEINPEASFREAAKAELLFLVGLVSDE